MKQKIGELLKIYWDFAMAHRALCFVLSAITFAACAAGLYLLFLELPTLMNMPCFRGGCMG